MARDDAVAVKSVKQTHVVQLKELESKAKDELDLLEGIRDYMKVKISNPLLCFSRLNEGHRNDPLTQSATHRY